MRMRTVPASVRQTFTNRNLELTCEIASSDTGCFSVSVRLQGDQRIEILLRYAPVHDRQEFAPPACQGHEPRVAAVRDRRLEPGTGRDFCEVLGGHARVDRAVVGTLAPMPLDISRHCPRYPNTSKKICSTSSAAASAAAAESMTSSFS